MGCMEQKAEEQFKSFRMGRYFPIHIRPERAEAPMFLFSFFQFFNEMDVESHVTDASSHMTLMANLLLILFAR